MSISQLLAAAEWLERRERGLNNLGGLIIPLVLSELWIIDLVQRLQDLDLFKRIFVFLEAEHGYASTAPEDYSRRDKTRPSAKAKISIQTVVGGNRYIIYHFFVYLIKSGFSLSPKKKKKLGCLCTKEVFPTFSHLDV